MNPTPQQLALWATAPSPAGNIAVDAVAGSGKTFSCTRWAEECPGTGLATSFANSTTEELGKKMPPNFRARSLHGCGKDAITSSGKFKAICDGKKVPDKLFDLIKPKLEAADESWQLIPSIKNLISQAQTAGIVPNHDEYLLEDTVENWELLAEQYDIDFTPFIYETARSTLIESNRIALDDGLITFDDMLYLPLFWPHRFTRYETVIVDERQDLSPIQHAMLERLVRPGGRILAVGDERQAIYGFRGAMHDSCAVMDVRFAMQRFPLTVSFRCPKAVVREAQRYVPHIQSADGAIEGDVIHHEHLPIRKTPSTVLCRNNAPLVRLALRLLINGISAEVAGRDIGTGLISLTKRIASSKSSDTMKTPDFISRLDNWAAREISRKPRNKHKVLDKQAALVALCESHRTLGDVRKHLMRLYPNPKERGYKPAQVHLSTIHKAKGKEWPEVLFLDPQLLPSQWAEQEWEKQQESNLAYVGITRAQEVLHYAKSENIQ